MTKQQIVVCYFLVLISGVSLVTAQDPCLTGNYIMASAPYSRSSKHDPTPDQIYLCDAYAITDGQWVRFDADSSAGPGCYMPEHCVTGPKCGTQNPIWMDGKHPSSTAPGPVDAFSCVRTSTTECCGLKQPMQVKWCSPGFFVYKVKPPPSCYMAHCCDEPPIAGPKLDLPHEPVPTVSNYAPLLQLYPKTGGTFGVATLPATLFSVDCATQFQANAQEESADFGSPVVMIYLVVQQADHNFNSLSTAPFNQTTFENQSHLFGEDKLHGYLEKQLSCRTVSYWDRWPTIMTNLTGPGEILQVLPSRIGNAGYSDRVIVLTEGDQYSFYLHPNFPVTSPYCFSHSGQANSYACYYNFNVKIQTSKVGAGTNKCFIRILPDGVSYPSDADTSPTMVTVSMAKTIGTRVPDFYNFIDFEPLLTQNQLQSIFYNYTIPTITVIIKDDKPRPRCVVSGYLSIAAFNSRSSTDLSLGAGDYYMVRFNESANQTLEVQIRIEKCHQYETALCITGMYAREGNNVIGVVLSDTINSVPRIISYQTVLNDSYGDVIPKPSVLEAEINKWKIVLLSDVEINVTLANGNLNVDILAFSYQPYTGLCTVANGNFATHSVPKEKSLFCYIAQCVNQVIPQRRCDCTGTSNDTYVPELHVVCRAEYDNNNTVATLNLIDSYVCKNNVNVIGSGSQTPTSIATDGGTSISVYSAQVFPSSSICNVLQSPTAPANVVWPTPKQNITEQMAQKKCDQVLRSSPVYGKCLNFVLVDDLMKQCIRDIQKTEDLTTAIPYLSKFNDNCVYDLETRIILYPNGTDKSGFQSQLDAVKALLCPSNCSFRGEVRGNCTNGICQCYTGFHGIGCSFKEGSVPGNIHVPAAINYTTSNISTLILLSADNVEPLNITARQCRYTLTSPDVNDPPVVKYVHAELMAGGLIACVLYDDLVKSQYTLTICLTNDGQNYSPDQTLILYDGTCMNCTNSANCVLLTGTRIVNGQCEQIINPDPCQWISHDNSQSWYGVQQGGVNTLDECMRRCCNSSNCVALDFNNNTGSVSCWFHSDSALVDSTRQAGQGIFQRVKVACRPCQSTTWSQFSNKNSFGATKYDLFQTADACKRFCECKDNCVGLDYDRVQNSCWIHTSSDAISAKYDNNNVDQYIIKCQAPPTPCMKWDILKQTQAIGAQFYENLQTLASCLKHCEDLPNCVAADINSGSSTIWCWLHLSKQQADNTRRSASGVDQYVLRRCPSGSCSSLWLPYPGYQSYYGTKQNGVNTADACKTACEGLSGCVGVDFALDDNSCWSQSDSNSIVSNRVSNSQVNQFYLLRPVSNCQIGWVMNPGIHSMGATLDSSVSTLDDCKQKCVDDQTCVAIDWNHGNTLPQCWLHRAASNLNGKYPDSNIDQYVISRP